MIFVLREGIEYKKKEKTELESGITRKIPMEVSWKHEYT